MTMLFDVACTTTDNENYVPAHNVAESRRAHRPRLAAAMAASTPATHKPALLCGPSQADNDLVCGTWFGCAEWPGFGELDAGTPCAWQSRQRTRTKYQGETVMRKLIAIVGLCWAMAACFTTTADLGEATLTDGETGTVESALTVVDCPLNTRHSTKKIEFIGPKKESSDTYQKWRDAWLAECDRINKVIKKEAAQYECRKCSSANKECAKELDLCNPYRRGTALRGGGLAGMVMYPQDYGWSCKEYDTCGGSDDDDVGTTGPSTEPEEEEESGAGASCPGLLGACICLDSQCIADAQKHCPKPCVFNATPGKELGTSLLLDLLAAVVEIIGGKSILFDMVSGNGPIDGCVLTCDNP